MQDKKITAHDIMNKARRAMAEGKTAEAISHIESATKLYEQIYEDDSMTLGDYYTKYADILSLKFDAYDKAIVYYQNASNMFEKANNTLKQAISEYNISELYDVELDDLEKSADHLNNALTLYMEDDDKSINVALCLDKLASLYFRLNEYDISKSAILKALIIYDMHYNGKTQLAEVYHNAGKLLFDMRYLDDSLICIDNAMEIYKNIQGDQSENYLSAKHEYAIIRAYKGSDLH